MNSKFVTSSLVRKMELLVHHQAQILLSPLAEASPSPSSGCGRLVGAFCSWRQGLTTHQCFSRLKSLVVHSSQSWFCQLVPGTVFWRGNGKEMCSCCLLLSCHCRAVSHHPGLPFPGLSEGRAEMCWPQIWITTLTNLSVTCLPANC